MVEEKKGAAQQFFCNFRVGCGTGSSSLGSRVQKAVAREPLAVNLSKATSRSIKMRGRSSLHYSQRAIQRPHLLLQEKRPCQKPSEPRSRAAPSYYDYLIERDDALCFKERIVVYDTARVKTLLATPV